VVLEDGGMAALAALIETTPSGKYSVDVQDVDAT
jgi:hypothetical protein